MKKIIELIAIISAVTSILISYDYPYTRLFNIQAFILAVLLPTLMLLLKSGRESVKSWIKRSEANNAYKSFKAYMNIMPFIALIIGVLQYLSNMTPSSIGPGAELLLTTCLYTLILRVAFKVSTVIEK